MIVRFTIVGIGGKEKQMELDCLLLKESIIILEVLSMDFHMGVER